MASDTGCAEDNMTPVTDDVSVLKQNLETVEDRLMTLSDQLVLFETVLSDLRDLSDILVKKSLQDMSLPQQE